MNIKKRLTIRLKHTRELLCDEDAMLAFVAKRSNKRFRKHNRTLFATNGHRRFRRVMRSIREGHGSYYSKLLERRILLSQGGDTWLAAKDNKLAKILAKFADNPEDSYKHRATYIMRRTTSEEE